MLLFLSFWIFLGWWYSFHAWCKISIYHPASFVYNKLCHLNGLIAVVLLEFSLISVMLWLFFLRPIESADLLDVFPTLGSFRVCCLLSSSFHWYLSRSWSLIPSFHLLWFFPAVCKWRLNIHGGNLNPLWLQATYHLSGRWWNFLWVYH